jgi:hypothetical protein
MRTIRSIIAVVIVFSSITSIGFTIATLALRNNNNGTNINLGRGAMRSFSNDDTDALAHKQ